MIDKRIVDRVTGVARIADVVGAFRELRKSGVELTCPCPFHGGKALGHFKVNVNKNMCYCFVCGKGGGPVDYLKTAEGMTFPDAIRWLGARYGIDVDEEQKVRFRDVQRTKVKPIVVYSDEQLPTLSLPIEMVRKYLGTENNLCRWMEGLPWSDEQRERLPKVLRSYGVGTSRKGNTIFWQIDDNKCLHTGKIMAYKMDGHRDKEARHGFDWVHSMLDRCGRRELYDVRKQKMRVCLFGLHLLNTKMAESNTVNIVESEKTALLMATAVGSSQGIWMATGGLQFLNSSILQPIINRNMNIVLYPDHDGEQKWKEKMAKIPYRKLFYNDMWTRIYWKPCDGEKADCADVMLRMLNERVMSDDEVCAKLMKKCPLFFEKFNLEIV